MNVCPTCGQPEHEGVQCGEEVSDSDASLDALIEQASWPSLADLYRRAKETGAIAPAFDYAGAKGGGK